MVHGIGKHLPGYSGRLTEHLMRALKLDVREELDKVIYLRHPKLGDLDLGVLTFKYLSGCAVTSVFCYSKNLCFIALSCSTASALDVGCIIVTARSVTWHGASNEALPEVGQ